MAEFIKRFYEKKIRHIMGGPSLSRFFLGADRGERPWYHFALTCSTYSLNRQLLFSHIPDIEYFRTLNKTDKLKFLVNDPVIVKQTAKFTVASFELRSTLI